METRMFALFCKTPASPPPAVHGRGVRRGSTAGTLARRSFAAVFVPALLALGLMPSAADAQGKRTVVILKTTGETTGLPPGQIRGSIRGTLADELKTYSVLTEEQSQALVKSAQELELDCKREDRDCLLKLGILGNVDFLIWPVVEKIDGTQVLKVGIFDVSEGADWSQVVRPLASPDLAATAARSAMIELMAPDQFVGRLAINVNAKGALIRVDGEDKGLSPLPAPLNLKAGEHLLEISAAGLQPDRRKIDVPFGKLASVNVDLVAELPTDTPEAPTAAALTGNAPSWKVPAAIGLGSVAGIAVLVAAVTGGIAGAINYDVFLGPDSGENLKNFQMGRGISVDPDTVVVANVLSIAAIAAGTVSVGFAAASASTLLFVE